MNMIEKIFTEDNGNPSTMRVLVFIVVCTVLFNWTYYNITTGTLTSFEMNELGALLGPFFFKAYQKGKEAKANA